MNLDLIRAAVGHRWPDAGFFFHEEIGSTNDEAARLARDHAPEGTVVFADRQSAGRGRRGARWHSPPGNDLLLSIVLRPSFPRRHWSRITLASALAIRQAIQEMCGLEAGIKWPNDLLIGGRKVAGILMEAHESRESSQAPVDAFAVLGIGLNVNGLPDDFPAELRDISTSLRAARDGRRFDREVVGAALLPAVLDVCAACGDDASFRDLLQEVRRHSTLLGREVLVTLSGREFTGVARDLDSEGHLIVDTFDRGALTLAGVDRIRLAGIRTPDQST